MSNTEEDNDDPTEPLLGPSEPVGEAELDIQRAEQVVGSLPLAAWAIIVVEVCERFAYFGLNGPLQNFIELPSDDLERPGGLGLGQRLATTWKLLFMYWCYTTPILTAIVADQYIGRLRTIVYTSWIYVVGLLILLLVSISTGFTVSLRMLGLTIALILIGLGTGGIKTNANALLAEQYDPEKDRCNRRGSGVKIVIDHEATMQRIYATFFLLVNLGSLAAFCTTFLEAKPGSYVLVFSLVFGVFVVGLSILFLTRRFYKVTPPNNAIALNACKVLIIASLNKFQLEAARPRRSNQRLSFFKFTWNDDFVDHVRSTLKACKLLAFFPVYWAAFSQMLTNFVSQAGTMESHGIPNDFLPVLDPLVIVLSVPILDRTLFPILRKKAPHLMPGPAQRILIGFMLGAVAMACAAFVQARIYASGPCFSYPKSPSCPKANKVHILTQVPAYVFLALSEVMMSTTGLEVAFVQAPPTMKSLVMAIFLSTNAVGALFATLFWPLEEHPYMVWLYSSLCGMLTITGLVFAYFAGIKLTRTTQ